MSYGILAHLSHCDRWMFIVSRLLCFVNNHVKGHLLNYWLDFDKTWQE